jgi:predicted small secreted protein
VRDEALILVSAARGLLAACNTVAGVGEDISGAARTVQNTF